MVNVCIDSNSGSQTRVCEPPRVQAREGWRVFKYTVHIQPVGGSNEPKDHQPEANEQESLIYGATETQKEKNGQTRIDKRIKE